MGECTRLHSQTAEANRILLLSRAHVHETTAHPFLIRPGSVELAKAAQYPRSDGTNPRPASERASHTMVTNTIRLSDILLLQHLTYRILHLLQHCIFEYCLHRTESSYCFFQKRCGFGSLALCRSQMAWQHATHRNIFLIIYGYL